MIFEYLWSIVVVFGIFGLTYVSVKYLGRRVNFKVKSNAIELIDSILLDRETRISIIKIQTQFFVMSHSKTGSSTLVLLENFTPSTHENKEPSVFFASYLQKFKKEQSKNDSE